MGVLGLAVAALCFFSGAMAVAAYYWRRDFVAVLSTQQKQLKILQETHLALSKLDLESINRRLGELEMRRNLR